MLSMGEGKAGFVGADRRRSAPEWSPELGAVVVALVLLVALVL